MNIFLCLVVTLFLSAPVVADDVADTVVLKFDFEAGLISRAEVFAERIRVKNGEQQVQSVMTAEGRSRVEAHPKGLVVIQNTDNVKIDSDMGKHSNVITQMMETVSMIETRYVISYNGEILGVEGLEPVLESLQETVGVIISDAPDEAKPMLNKLLPQFASKELISAKAFEEWYGQVEQWIGAEFEKGYYYDVEYAEEVAVFGGVELGFTGSYEYKGKTSCNEKDTEKSCVELVFQSTLLRDSAEKFTNAIFKQMKVPVPDGFAMAVDTSILLVTEPTTLKPHYYEKVKTVSTPSGGEKGTEERIDRTTYTYFYD